MKLHNFLQNETFTGIILGLYWKNINIPFGCISGKKRCEMDWTFFKPYFEVIKFQSRNSLPQTKAAFKELVDAIIPNTPDLAEKQGSIQLFGALDLHTDEYQVWSLNHYLSLVIVIKGFDIYLANATAEMLDIAARKLINTEENEKSVNSAVLPEEGAFAALEPSDRFRAITLLQQLNIDLATLPIPFHNNPGFALTVTGVITLLTVFGYYSEWSGYGSTRLESPENRKIEHFPTSWKQVGYPGPSKGYHALRGNYDI